MPRGQHPYIIVRHPVSGHEVLYANHAVHAVTREVKDCTTMNDNVQVNKSSSLIKLWSGLLLGVGVGEKQNTLGDRNVRPMFRMRFFTKLVCT